MKRARDIMTKTVQKEKKCNRCGNAIRFKRVSGKWVCVNLYGERHSCTPYVETSTDPVTGRTFSVRMYPDGTTADID
jgi:hypothetical protein